MIMSPVVRKVALTAHVTSSVGLLGAVAAFLALAVAGLGSQQAALVRGAYLAMDLIAWLVIVPLAFASLVTGVVQALGTKWGLFRHYWVLAKLLLTVIATIVLLVQMKPIGILAGAAAEATWSSPDLGGLQLRVLLHAGGGLLVLLVVTTLAVFKPWGMTRYGARKHSG
jgi:hypothetical protein